MLTIGLTGGIASGKSTVARYFEARGVEVIDADEISRQVVAPGEAALNAIVDHFGNDIVDAEGNLNRARLREIVFNNVDERRWLEELLHPLIHAVVRRRLENCNSPYCLLMSPLLLETEQHQLVDHVLVVDVSPQTQLQRALARDGSNRKTIEAIISAQKPRQDRLAFATDIINNAGTQDELEAEVEKLHAKYLERARRQDG